MEREAWEVAFEEWIDRTHPGLSADYAPFNPGAPAIRKEYRSVWQAALASRQGAEGVTVALDPRWKWCGVDARAYCSLYFYEARPRWNADHWQYDCTERGCESSEPIIFAGLKPSTLYEIIDGRFVERESHA